MISNILYVQPIFIPDEIRFEQNKRSIESFATYIETYPTELSLEVILGGWAINDLYWNKIVDVIKNCGLNTDVKRFDKNYGKAYIVNNLIEFKKASNFQAFLTADSDMVFTLNDKYLLDRLVNIAAIEKNWGIIALNQYEQCCHLPVVNQNTKNVDIKVNDINFSETLVWPTKPGGIAGGCLFLNRQMWEDVNGYRLMGVYAGDDAYLLIDCNAKKFSYILVKSLGVIHPFSNDIEYAKWKVKVCQRDSGKTITDNTGHLEEANEFWKNRKK